MGVNGIMGKNLFYYTIAQIGVRDPMGSSAARVLLMGMDDFKRILTMNKNPSTLVIVGD